jgi:hypothetical protein
VNACLVAALLPESDTRFGFLPAGGLGSSAALLHRSSIDNLLARMRNQADLLLVADRSVLEHGVSPLTATVADAVFVLWDGADQSALEATARQLRDSGAAVAGVLLDVSDGTGSAPPVRIENARTQPTGGLLRDDGAGASRHREGVPNASQTSSSAPPAL